jgi:hypothetical protein
MRFQSPLNIMVRQYHDSGEMGTACPERETDALTVYSTYPEPWMPIPKCYFLSSLSKP